MHNTRCSCVLLLRKNVFTSVIFPLPFSGGFYNFMKIYIILFSLLSLILFTKTIVNGRKRVSTAIWKIKHKFIKCSSLPSGYSAKLLICFLYWIHTILLCYMYVYRRDMHIIIIYNEYIIYSTKYVIKAERQYPTTHPTCSTFLFSFLLSFVHQKSKFKQVLKLKKVN